MSGDHILISLDARHAESILEGRKFVEFRRRSMNVEAGTTVWIYAKLPIGSIVGRATITAIRMSSPSSLWRRFWAVSGISKSEFIRYFEGASQGTALELSQWERLTSSFSLESLRRFDSCFQPPQFFARLREGTPLLTAIAGSPASSP